MECELIWRRALGKTIGVLAGMTCAGLAAVFMLANPYYHHPPTAYQAGVWVAIVPGIGAAGILAAIASLLNARRTLVALFVASFFPFSLFLMPTPGIFRWFAVAEMGYVVAAILLGTEEPAFRGSA
jgi:hypothetical protein